MKDKLISSFVLVSVISIYNICAQNKFQPEYSVGIKVGTNFSEIGIDTLLDQKFQPGFNAGIVCNFIAEPHFGIQVELDYTQKGWTEKIDTSSSYKRQINYFEVPFLTRIETGIRSTRLYIILGPYLSFKINEKSTYSKNRGIKDYYKNNIDNNLGYGLCGGIGILQKTKIGNFEIESRFSHDLGNIFKPDHYSVFSRSQNQVISIYLSYLIDL